MNFFLNFIKKGFELIFSFLKRCHSNKNTIKIVKNHNKEKEIRIYESIKKGKPINANHLQKENQQIVKHSDH